MAHSRIELAVLAHIQELADLTSDGVAPPQAVQFLAHHLGGTQRVIVGLKRAGVLVFDGRFGGYALTPAGVSALALAPYAHGMEPNTLPENAIANLAAHIQRDPDVLSMLSYEHIERPPRKGVKVLNQEELLLVGLRDLAETETRLKNERGDAFDGLWNELSFRVLLRLYPDKEDATERYLPHRLREWLRKDGLLASRFGGLGSWWTRWFVTDEGHQAIRDARGRLKRLLDPINPPVIENILKDSTPPDLAHYHQRYREIAASRRSRRVS